MGCSKFQQLTRFVKPFNNNIKKNLDSAGLEPYIHRAFLSGPVWVNFFLLKKSYRTFLQSL
ncbi:MAG: hypothetical protein EAY75_06550 [Bacteroidetes bacterium]|nr:MAG: hypothetical protein EAY75_06550 [Bacteroidota bacterium]